MIEKLKEIENMVETYRPSGFFTLALFIIIFATSLWLIWEFVKGNFCISIFLIIALAFDYVLFSRLKEYSLSDNDLTITHQLLRTNQTISFRDIDSIETIYNPPGQGKSRLPASYLVRVRYKGALLTIYFYDAGLCNMFITRLTQLSGIPVVKK
jgi:hypothetical protein